VWREGLARVRLVTARRRRRPWGILGDGVCGEKGENM
jgi:hypothetical protein